MIYTDARVWPQQEAVWVKVEKLELLNQGQLFS